MDYGGYNRSNRSGGGGERIIPISIDGGRQPNNPQPQLQPSYPHPQPYGYPGPPTRPERQRDNINPGNPRISAPVQPIKIPEKQSSTTDFTSHELDEMDEVLEILKRKRAAEEKGDNNYPGNNYKSSSNSRNYAYAEIGGQPDPDNDDCPDQPRIFPGEDPNKGNYNNYPPINNDLSQSKSGFVLPPPLPNMNMNVTNYAGDTGQNHNLPYPNNSGVGIPEYPSQQFFPNTPYPNSHQTYYSNPGTGSAPYPTN